MLRILFLLLVWLISMPVGLAQNNLKIQLSGLVEDNNGAKLGGVMVVFVKINDSTSITYAGSTDNNGRFTIPVNLKENYKLRFSLLGYQTKDSQIIRIDSTSKKLDIGVIKLTPIPYLLKEVNVISKKPLVSFNNNTAKLNVAGRSALLGNTPLEILKLAPGVIISNSTIQLNGKNNVIILINGKKQFFNTEQAIQFLQNSSSDNISQIEVSSFSSSKYDSEGSDGTINIITKKSLTDGTKGSASVAYNQGKYAKFSPLLNLINSKKSIVTSASYNYVYSENFENTTNFQKELIDGSPLLNVATNKVQGTNMHIARIGIDYTLDKFHTLGFSSNANINYGYSNNNTFSTYYKSVNPLYIINQLDHEQINYNSSFNNLNYSAKLDSGKRDFSIDLNYGFYVSNPLNNFSIVKLENLDTEQVDIRDKKSSKVNILALNSNYSKKYRDDSIVEFGTKLSYSLSSYKVYFDSLRAGESFKNNYISSVSEYKEFVPAVYGIYKSVRGRLNYDLGLRLETTIANIDFVTNQVQYHLHNYYPSLNLSYKQSKTERISFSFRKGIYRPPYLTMNPTVIYYNKFSYFQGNPNLRPSIYYSFNLSQIIANKYSINLGYTLTKGGISQVYDRDINTDITKITYSNINRSASYNMTIYLPINPFKWWEISNNIFFYYLHYLKYDKTLFPDINRGNFIYRMSSSHIFNLPGKLYGDLSLYYISQNRFNQTFLNPYLTIDMGIKRTFYNNKFTASLGVNDITNQITKRGVSYYNFTSNETYSKDDSRRYKIAISYRFGNVKANNSRQRKTGIEDEQNRTTQQQ